MKNIIVGEEVTQQEKAQIVKSMTAYVKSIVNKSYYPKANPLVSKEDLISVGMLGLLEAIDRYEPSPNNTFSTYAYYRIHGNIVDYIRSVDLVPRSVRSTLGKFKGAQRKLSQKLGRQPNDKEVLEELGLSVERWRSISTQAKARAETSLDSPVFQNDGRPTSFYDILEDEKSKSPEHRFQTKNLQRILENSGKYLTDQEMEVVNLYYFSEKDYNHREIGERMGFSEARGCQLRLAALNKLNYHLKYLETGYDYA